MLSIAGIVIVFAMVFGGYIIAGGSMAVIFVALPIEMMIIGGATAGSFCLGNKAPVIKKAMKDIGVCFKGSRWHKQDYSALLCLLFQLVKTIKSKGILALEPHIENPHESPIFSQYPKIVHDHFAVDFICDTLRMITMSLEDPYQIEDSMQKQLDKHHHEALAGSEALQGMADSLPAIGIVAAVLGVVKTMSHIDSPPAILGRMIGNALVGTFLGVFLAYCFMGPFASKAKAIHNQDAQFYLIIRDVMVAHLKGNAPQVSVEIGRGSIPTDYQPSFFELEAAMNEIKI